jgi:hypothetical protein
MAREPVLGGPHDAPFLLCRHGSGGIFERFAPLDLDKHETLVF